MRAFDSDRLAALEVGMWKAYYARRKARLFRLLVTMLREQFHCPWSVAARVGFRFARAAATFGDATAGYARVLPDLEHGYALLGESTGERFDAAELARRELAWWVARRDPAGKSPENVGRLIAAASSILYSRPIERVAQAGLLRAQAAALRDSGEASPDWPQIARLLRESYARLREGVQ